MSRFDFSQELLKWFDLHGRNNLPWQENPTPYRVWISEIMLQQTQVSTVIPFFKRFMESYPDMNSLSNASMEQVMHLLLFQGKSSSIALSFAVRWQ